MWKDLPSGNWAEMMDFWHCHKPDPEGGHEHGDGEGEGGLDAGEQQQRQQQQQQGAKAGGGGRSEDPNATVKGYGAANQVVATVGTILVDVAAFLVAVEDCLGVMKVRTCSFFCGLFVFFPEMKSFCKAWCLPESGQQEGDLSGLFSSVLWSPIQLPDINHGP